MSDSDATAELPPVDIKPLLQRLWPCPPPEDVDPEEIANAVAHFFTNQVSQAQTSALLICLHFTGLDRRADVIAACAARMRQAAAKVADEGALRALIEKRGRKEGRYQGGLVDMVGTGGDSHNTFNISTTASILASSLLMMAKHGNKASTSRSGSADLLASMTFPTAPTITNVSPATIADVYAQTNYAFLFAPVFHPGMRFVAPVRRQLPWRTIFNLLGPLSNPLDTQVTPLEARLIGVARRDLGPVFAEAFRLAGVRNALVVCGEEELDEISCAGRTLCWRLREEQVAGEDGRGVGSVRIDHFTLHPSDFGLPSHPLSAVGSGGSPEENAAVLHKILTGEMAADEPLLDFVLLNTAALFEVSGICEADTSSMGHGDDGIVIKERGPGGGRWKEGVRRARWAIQSGEAWRQWEAFVRVTNSVKA